MNALYHELFRIIDRYRGYPNIEIEARLGWKTSNYFDTNIQAEFYETLKTKLKQSCMIERQENTRVYVMNQTRVITTMDNRIKDAHRKVKLLSIDLGLEGSPYDVRLSVCQERPVSKQTTNQITPSRGNLIRTRERSQFIHKMFNYDLTKVFVHATDSHVYEFELELNLHNVSRLHSTHYLSHSMAMKIEDIVKISVNDCENIHLKNVTYI